MITTETLTSHDYDVRPWASPGTSLYAEVKIPSRFSPLAAEVRGFLDLEADWDSYGARRVQWDAARKAFELLAQLGEDLPVPSVVPTAAGGLQFEWGGDGDVVEIEVGPTGTLTALIDLNGESHERSATGLGDPLITDALMWAAKLG